MRVLTGWAWKFAFRGLSLDFEHVPATGPVLLVPNHSAFVDPFVQTAMQRRDGVRFMAKAEYLDMRIRGRFFHAIGCFPVRRGTRDTAALEIARALLAAGEPVMVFPEGTRQRRALELGPPKRGAAILAIETGAPVVPVATWGLKPRRLYRRPWWRRPRTVTIYGRPMYFGDLECTPANVELVRDTIWERVCTLYAQAREMDALRG